MTKMCQIVWSGTLSVRPFFTKKGTPAVYPTPPATRRAMPSQWAPRRVTMSGTTRTAIQPITMYEPSWNFSFHGPRYVVYIAMPISAIAHSAPSSHVEKSGLSGKRIIRNGVYEPAISR